MYPYPDEEEYFLDELLGEFSDFTFSIKFTTYVTILGILYRWFDESLDFLEFNCSLTIGKLLNPSKLRSSHYNKEYFYFNILDDMWGLKE